MFKTDTNRIIRTRQINSWKVKIVFKNVLIINSMKMNILSTVIKIES